MSQSIESRDAIFILQRALRHLKTQGKNFTDYDDVFELQSHICLLSFGGQTI